MAKKAVVTYGKAEPLYMDVHLEREHFDSAIYDKGYTCFIDKAMSCPCADTSTGHALSTCKNCGGCGFFWINRRETRLLITNMTYHKFQENWTEANTGTVSISARPEDKVSFMDRIIVCELESTYIQKSKIFIKSEKNGSKTPFCLLFYKPIEIENIYLFNGSDNKLTIIPDNDYTVQELGLILNDKYANGATISIRYKHNPVYYIADVLRENVITYKNKEDKIKLPLHYVGKRANLVLDEENLFNERLFDNSDYTKVDKCTENETVNRLGNKECKSC